MFGANQETKDLIKRLPMWTQIHIQPLEGEMVYWVKNSQVEFSAFNTDFGLAIMEFVSLWESKDK